MLDEITVDLDLLTRQRLLAYLHTLTSDKMDPAHRVTIVYATHILDGLGTWPTHILHMALGKVQEVVEFLPFIQPFLTDASRSVSTKEVEEDAMDLSITALRQKTPAWRRFGWDSPLLCAVEQWLREDSDAALKHEQEMDKASTHWQELSENARKYGDKFYNYWG